MPSSRRNRSGASRFNNGGGSTLAPRYRAAKLDCDKCGGTGKETLTGSLVPEVCREPCNAPSNLNVTVWVPQTLPCKCTW